MKEIKEDTKSWKIYTMFLDQKNQYSENEYAAPTIYRFNVIPIKLPMAFFTELEQQHNKTSNSKIFLRKWSRRNQDP